MNSADLSSKRSLTGSLLASFMGRTGARVAASLLLAFGFILLARALDAAVFGNFATLVSVGYIASALFGFGASMRILRIGAESDADLGRRLVGLRLWGATGTFVATVALGVAIGHSYVIVAMAVSLVLVDSILEFLQMALAGVNRQGASAVVCVTQRLIFAVCALMIVFWSSLGEWAFVIVQLLVLAGSIWWVIRLLGARLLPGRAFVRSQFGYWMSSMASNINQLELPGLNFASGHGGVVGGYAVASRLLNPLTLVAGVYQVVFVPKLATSDGGNSFNRILRLGLVGVSGYSVLVVALSPVIADVYLWLLGQDYKEFRGLILAFVVSAALSVVSQVLQAVLLSVGMVGLPAAVIVGGSVGGIVLLMFLGSFATNLIWLAPLLAQFLILFGMACAFVICMRRRTFPTGIRS